MRPRLLLISAIMVLVSVSGCARKKPAELPPPPQAGVSPAQGNTAPPNTIDNAVIPGSRADFLQQAGTDTIHFDTDRSDVDSQAQAILAAQAKWLVTHPNVRITIEGHCDERGTREYNLALGDRRANAAKNFLATLGVDIGRMRTISYGKERPIALGSDEAAWAQNRRAVTVILQ